jgi:hypothetical protein
MSGLPKARVVGHATARGLSRVRGFVAGINWRIVLGSVGGAVAATFIGGLIYWACGHDHAQASVKRVAWQHETDLRERRVYSDGDWGDPPSQGGYYREPTWDHDCYNKFSHMSCTTVGKATICVPVYRTWCDYKYYDWPGIDQKTIEGEGHEMSWQTFGKRLDGNHRETHVATYTVDFANPDGRHWTYVTRSDADYAQFEVGDPWDLDLPHVGSMRPVKKAQLEKPE